MSASPATAPDALSTSADRSNGPSSAIPSAAPGNATFAPAGKSGTTPVQLAEGVGVPGDESRITHQVNGGRSSKRSDKRPAVRQARAVRSRSSSVTRLPITRSATVISARDRIPTGPATGSSRGRVSRPASRRAIEKASP